MRLAIELGPGFRRTCGDLSGMGQAVRAAASAGLKKGVKIAAGRVVSDYMSGQALKRRTGNLARAVDGWMESELDGVVGVRDAAAVDRYKWLLGDEVKTITPKRGKFLAIPIGENLTGAGATRRPSPRDYPDGFFFRSKRGQLLFGRRLGKTRRARIRPLFVLKKSVQVEGSGALADGVLDSEEEIARILQTEIDGAMKQ